MKIVIITLPHYVENEGLLIAEVLKSGANRVHVRKPSWNEEQHRELIQSIPEEHLDRITIHDFHSLALEFNIGGIHLNSRNPIPLSEYCGRVSRSCHSVSELEGGEDYDYQTLSPIYDSISKSGYLAAFSYEELREAKQRGVIGTKTYALGGVTPESINDLYDLGFGGVMMLGYIWEELSMSEISNRVKKAVKAAKLCDDFKLQYIAHHNAAHDELSGAMVALEGGCRWVQLRMKGASDEHFIEVAHKLAKACRSYGATFLLNDRAHLVEQCGADGVHLGREDISVVAARAQLGESMIIGGTANTHEDIKRLVESGVDYIGYGPFRFTTTKERLSPVLGLEGYQQVSRFKAESGYSVPIVAIGGITLEDIRPIMACGVQGIALSGTIINAQNPVSTTKKIIGEL